MKKYQCYYIKPIFVNGRSYRGKRVDTKIFDTEEQAERYCNSHVGTIDVSDDINVDYEVLNDGLGSYIECEMMYDEIEV